MNFREVQDAVADWLNRDDLTSRIPTFVNNAILSLERRFNFTYMESVETYLNVTSHILPTPLDYKHSRFMYVIDSSGNRQLLRHLDPKGAIAAFPNFTQNVGMPLVFATIDGGSTFLLRPTPDTAYTIELNYYAKSPPLVDDYDTNWLTENAPDVLIFGALLQAEPFLGVMDLHAVWQERFNTELNYIGASGLRENHLGSYQVVSNRAVDIV